MTSYMSKLPTSPPWLISNASDVVCAHTAFATDGLLVQPDAVSTATTSAAQAAVIDSLEAALTLPLAQSSRLLGEIREPMYRYDIKLELTQPVLALVRELCASPLGMAVATALGGPANARLVELACITSSPGARAQPPHCDTGSSEAGSAAGVLISCFVALHDLQPAMGPTLMYPATHGPAFHAAVANKGPRVLHDGSIRGVHMDLDAGGAVAMDSRCWHCGGANDSAQRRCLLVASFTAANAPLPNGSTYSLLPHIEQQRLTIAALRRLDGRSLAPAPAAEVADEMGTLPLQAACLLARLAAKLPADEPRVKQCHQALAEALQAADAEDQQGGTISLPLAVLRVLGSFRVIGPHLRASPRFGPLQQCIDAALAAGGVAPPVDVPVRAPVSSAPEARQPPSNESTPSTAAITSLLAPATLTKLQSAGIDSEALVLELAPLVSDRPALLRRLQLACSYLTLSDRQGVANTLSRAAKAGRLAGAPSPTAQTAATTHALPPVASIRAAAHAALDDPTCTSGGALLARLPELEARGVLPPSHVRVLRDALELNGPRIGFWASQLTERGTEVALYDYADYAETILGATSYIIYNACYDANVPAVRQRFETRFGARCIGIDYQIELDAMLGDGVAESKGDDHEPESTGSLIRRFGLTHLYTMKVGRAADAPRVSQLSGHVHTCVHAVFDAGEPHGDTFARISPCVPGSATPVVPHIVRRRESHGRNLRAELGIPLEAMVYGRHGGYQTFDIDFVHEAVLEVACSRPDIYFILLNTAPFGVGPPPSNVIHLPNTLVDDNEKAAFVRTCDAMLHARARGETFGLAIAEFAAYGRPVLTSSAHHDGGIARFHLDVLADRGFYYHDKASCVALLTTFDRCAALAKGGAYWQAPYQPYAPERVMRTFRSVFLAPTTTLVPKPTEEVEVVVPAARLLIIGPGCGFAAKPHRARGIASFAMRNPQLPEPPAAHFPAFDPVAATAFEPGLDTLRTEITEFEPHVLLAGSRGSAYAAALIATGEWRGVTLLLGGTDTQGCVSTLDPPTSSGALKLHRAPVMIYHGTGDEVNPISAVVAQAVGAAPWVRLRRAIGDGHGLASINDPSTLAALVGEACAWAEQLVREKLGGAEVAVDIEAAKAREAMRKSMASKCALREAAARMSKVSQSQNEKGDVEGVSDSEWDD